MALVIYNINGDGPAKDRYAKEHDVSGEARDETGKWTSNHVALPIDPFPKSFAELKTAKYVDVWHGTTLQRLEKMIAKGGSQTGQRGQFCISPDFKHASQYPEFPEDGEDPIVISVRVPVESLLPDENDRPGVSLEDSLFHEWSPAADVSGGIKASQIRGVYGDSPDDPFATSEVGEETAKFIRRNASQ